MQAIFLEFGNCKGSAMAALSRMGLAWLSSRIWHHLSAYLINEWPSFMFVASLVTVIDHDAGWFNMVNNYALFAVGNLMTLPNSVGPARSLPQRVAFPGSKVTVVLIDEKMHQSRYLDHTPLNRCQLENDLESIFNAQPALVAIDLDISPALWLGLKNVAPNQGNDSPEERNQWFQQWLGGGGPYPSIPSNSDANNEARCQLRLYDLLIKKSKAGKKIKIVLMRPQSVLDTVMESNIERWREKMKFNDILFGSADLPIEYGFALALDELSIGGVASQYVRQQAPKPKKESPPGLINPAMYRSLEICDLYEMKLETAQKSEKCALPALHDRVVFFGGGWGQSDTVMTPIGEIFGVETHAASYLSFSYPINEMKTYIIDIAFAILFGFIVSYLWECYFQLRFGHDTCRHQYATACLIALMALVFMLLLASLVLSVLLLRWLDIWLTPVPIMSAMMVDSLFWGSIMGSLSQAAHEAGRSLDQTPHEAKTFWKRFLHSLYKFFYRDLSGLWHGADAAVRARKELANQSLAPVTKESGRQPAIWKDYIGAMGLMLLRRLGWGVVVGRACIDVFSP